MHNPATRTGNVETEAPFVGVVILGAFAGAFAGIRPLTPIAPFKGFSAGGAAAKTAADPASIKKIDTLRPNFKKRCTP